jgi:hypothetical protein
MTGPSWTALSPRLPSSGVKRIAATQIQGVDIMCMNCGCGKNEERHKPTDITLSDLKAAAKGHDMEVEKAADNIHDGARALKKSGQIS